MWHEDMVNSTNLRQVLIVIIKIRLFFIIHYYLLHLFYLKSTYWWQFWHVLYYFVGNMMWPDIFAVFTSRTRMKVRLLDFYCVIIDTNKQKCLFLLKLFTKLGNCCKVWELRRVDVSVYVSTTNLQTSKKKTTTKCSNLLIDNY